MIFFDHDGLVSNGHNLNGNPVDLGEPLGGENITEISIGVYLALSHQNQMLGG